MTFTTFDTFLPETLRRDGYPEGCRARKEEKTAQNGAKTA